MSNRKKLRKPLPLSFLSRPPHVAATYWNGERCRAERVRLRVADGPHPQYWARDLIGTVRDAVRVRYGSRTFYLDNEDGTGWTKVTTGFGSPGMPSKSLYGTEVVPQDHQCTETVSCECDEF